MKIYFHSIEMILKFNRIQPKDIICHFFDTISYKFNLSGWENSSNSISAAIIKKWLSVSNYWNLSVAQLKPTPEPWNVY